MPRPLAAALLAAAFLASPAAAQLVESDASGPPSRLAMRTTAPLTFALPMEGPLESRFGHRWGRLHAGLDISVLETDRVRGALGGVVVKVGYQRNYEGYGSVVVIRHGGGLSTLYAHLASFRVKRGEAVERGELIGRAGCTGSCTGAHLHFEVRERGKPVNPMRYLRQLL